MTVKISTFGSVLAYLFLTGCASSGPKLLEHGVKGYSIDCSGAFQSWAACDREAASICGSADAVRVLSRNDVPGASTAVADSSYRERAIGHFRLRTMVTTCQ